MDSGLDHHAARALLEWQVELGATEAIGDAPVNRYEAPDRLPTPDAPVVIPAKAPVNIPSNTPAPVGGPPPPVADVDAVGIARQAAAMAQDLGGLRAALAAFDLCELKRGARNLVFADGNAQARVMIIGEAPGRDEDRDGRPFVGQAGQFLDRMLAAIGLDRRETAPEKSVYITNVMPWRPPHNHEPSPADVAMMVPFVQRHVDLVSPDFLVLMGNISCDAGLGRRGVTRLRGVWTQAYGRPALPMVHPAYLLRQPAAKREAWADLLSLQARLRGQA